MALWNGSTINNTAVAMMFNQIYNLKAINQVSKSTGLLFLIRGKSRIEKDDQGNPKVRFDRMAKITGNKIEVRLLGKLPAWKSYADYTDEMATTSLDNSADYWGAGEFALGHFGRTHPIPDSEWQRIRGNEAKTKDYIAEVLEMLMAAKENYMATALNATPAAPGDVAGSRTVLGSWQYAVSDGVTAGETNNATYGTINRADAGNVDFRSVVYPTIGNLDLAKIRKGINQIRVNQGKVDLIETGLTHYNKVQQLVEGYTLVDYDEKMAGFGSEYFQYAGVNFCLDGYCPDGIMGGLDTSSFVWYENEDAPFNESGFMVDPSREATRVGKFNSWEQVLCKRPKSNFKMTGITS